MEEKKIIEVILFNTNCCGKRRTKLECLIIMLNIFPLFEILVGDQSALSKVLAESFKTLQNDIHYFSDTYSISF